MILGKEKLLKLLDKFKKIEIKDKTNVWNTEVIEALELENLLTSIIGKHRISS